MSCQDFQGSLASPCLDHLVIRNAYCSDPTQWTKEAPKSIAHQGGPGMLIHVFLMGS